MGRKLNSYGLASIEMIRRLSVFGIIESAHFRFENFDALLAFIDHLIVGGGGGCVGLC